MSQGDEPRWFHESEDSTWSPSPSPVALLPTDAPGHREGLEPPGPPGHPNCPLPLLPTPSFPEAHPSPDAPRTLVRTEGTVSAGGAFQSVTIPWGTRPGRQETPPPPFTPRPTSSPRHSVL